MRITFDQIDRFIKIYDGIRYLVLFDYAWFDKIYDRIKYLVSAITDSISHNCGRVRVDSSNSLLIEKMLTFLNVAILIKWVVNKNKKEYYYNIFLEKDSI